MDRFSFALLISLHMKPLYVEDSTIHLLTPLGEGGSGVVFLGILDKNGKRRRVAVKRAKHRLFENMLYNEARAMSQFKHENIVKILAINRDLPEIVIELMELGSLGDAVKKVNFSNKNVVQILKDVASGMEYLHSKEFIHRDLAVRNIFINGKKECKIGDFGTCAYVGNSKGIYEELVYDAASYNISPETLISKLFTVHSDVWAMGLLIIDAFHIATDESEYVFPMRVRFLKAFQSGMGNLEKPSRCPEIIFSFCKIHLLNRNANNRPSFTVIKKKMQEVLDQKTY